MSTKRRFLFGLLSTLFLSVGLVRAADRLDPIHVNGHLDNAIGLDQRGSATVAPDTNIDYPPF